MDIMSYLLGQNSGGAKKGMRVEVVTELPQTGEVNVLYLVPKQDTGENDIFEEWLYVEDEWEKIGTTDIDLSNYYTKGETLDITGLLSNLQTISKTNLVSAINELASSGSPIQLLDIGNIQDIEPGYLDDNTILKTIYGDGKYGVYLIKAHINYNDSNAIIGIMFAGQSTSAYTIQQFLGLKRTAANEFFSIMYRSIKNSNGTVVTGYKFMDTFLWLYNYAQNGTSFSSNDRHMVRGKDLAVTVGPKLLNSLTTSTKTSLVDAINEINPKRLTGYDASKTQTLKNINGTLTWVDD